MTTDATNVRNQATSSLNILYGESNTNPSTLTAISLVNHTSHTKASNQRNMTLDTEERREMTQMMTKRRSTIRSMRAHLRNLTRLIVAALTEPKLIWGRKWTPKKKPLDPKLNQNQDLVLDLNPMVLLVLHSLRLRLWNLRHTASWLSPRYLPLKFHMTLPLILHMNISQLSKTYQNCFDPTRWTWIIN